MRATLAGLLLFLTVPLSATPPGGCGASVTLQELLTWPIQSFLVSREGPSGRARRLVIPSGLVGRRAAFVFYEGLAGTELVVGRILEVPEVATYPDGERVVGEFVVETTKGRVRIPGLEFLALRVESVGQETTLGP
jgi:hypothetical protein